MIIIPAIDLKQGRCVRLLQGRFDQETVYSHDPAAMARRWAEAGAEWIHLVDLDGSVGQQPVNQAAVLAIREAVSVNLEIGGGIRDLETIAFYLESGLNRIILGTAAHQNPALVKEAASLFPGRIAVGLDARGSQIMVQGWTEATNQDFIDLARRYEDLGVAVLIYTDIDRDGMRTGPNLERTRELARAVSIPVIASGGVKDLEDIKQLLPLEADNVIGIITGKALYEGSLDFAQALALVSGPERR
ncbi:MAG: 1-(5-phosphoribosyl)-5-[(5-phosphoribosylamino)methylideneamino]imidazole-4-carboxamide isomerase [Deltaproteobacteria bacterium]|nr:1-(5-phosphoribosyl)-5-[(5-phosphoribosylamino)methylideneamino]imidazole-4-carboxamide isomerase [Deltaproteobacteria bacterium]